MQSPVGDVLDMFGHTQIHDKLIYSIMGYVFLYIVSYIYIYTVSVTNHIDIRDVILID